MRSFQKLKVVVPSRLGSNRIKIKSLRLLNGKALIEYCLDSMKLSKYFNDVTINSDSDLLGSIAKRNGVKFYKRKPDLATSDSMIDDFLYDFMVAEDSEYLAMVCPTAPFITAELLDGAWDFYSKSDCDTLLSCEKIQTHCFYNNNSINFSTNKQHPRSQDLLPVRALNFSVAIWNCKKFKEQYESLGHGVYSGKLSLYDTAGLANIDIDYEEDFLFAEFVARYLSEGSIFKPEYDSVAKDIIDNNIQTAN